MKDASRGCWLLVAVPVVLCSIACSSSGLSSRATCAGDAGGPDNGTHSSAVDLAFDLTDDPNTSRTVAWTPSSSSSEDWFKFHVRDTGLGGDPELVVSVDSGDVSTWFACDDGAAVDAFSCTRGTAESAPGYGAELGGIAGCIGETASSAGSFAASTTDCESTSEDDGVVYVRVTRTDCKPYTLTIKVE